jgi:hypothetical protein
MPDERLLELKARAAERFMAMPGVTGVGLGGRIRAGVFTGEPVLKVFVERKRPPADLAPGAALPADFEGVGVDVGEMAAPVLHGGLQADEAPPFVPLAVGSPPTTEADTDFKRYPHLIGGINLLPATPGGWYGTLGCLLCHATDPNKVYAITAFHLFARTAADPQPVVGVTRVGHPKAKTSPTKCCSHLIGTYAGGGADEIRDAALILLDQGTEWLAESLEVGVVTGTHTVSAAEAAAEPYQIVKRGANTRKTGGFVMSVNHTATTKEGITRDNLMVVTPFPYIDPQDRPNFFAADGDSGAAYLNVKGEVVALHLAGAPGGLIHNGYGIPIEATLAEFADSTKENLPLKVATATQLNQVRTKCDKAPTFTPTLTPAELPPPGGLPTYQEVFGQVGADLDDSATGRRLVDLWLNHHEELLALVNGNRRVTVAWRRGGGPALLQTFARVVADPALAVPYTINGEPPADRLERVYAAFHAAASPELRGALDQVRADLPDPAGLTYPQILAALAARGRS